MSYEQLLQSKIKVAKRGGIEMIEDEFAAMLHPSTMPHQRDIIRWCINMGQTLVAADAGLGKSHMAIETFRILHSRFGGKFLIVTELGAAETFVHPDPEVGEGARLGVHLEYVTDQYQALYETDGCFIVVTNYERVRMGEFDFGEFTGVWLDEGNYIKNMASETTEQLGKQLAKVKWKFIATATPSPNETLELINYAHVLGVCDRGQILTAFFKRNSTKAGELTLKQDEYIMLDQHKDNFWFWVYSWATFVTKPSDLGYDDHGYDLPELQVYWHEVKLGKALEGKIDRDGQKEMFVDSAASLPDAAKIKRESIDVRLEKVLDLVCGDDSNPEDHWIIWHHQEKERELLNISFNNHPSYGDLFGKQNWPVREQRIVDFSKGQLQILATKPEISGVGCNFQKHCHKAVFMGINHSFDDFYQALKRIYRFGQTMPVEIHLIYVPEEYNVVQNIMEKWRMHDEQRAKMREIVLQYGLNQGNALEDRKRSFKVDRVEVTGKDWTLVNNDCVHEFGELEADSVDMILTSIPFGNHYEYTDKYNDFGHNTTNDEFFKQMDYLLKEALRVLKPGRIAAFHTKNRIHYGSVTGLGFSILHRFTHKACDCFERNGFHCMGSHFVPTDVVAENNQTYRLTFGEMQKDATKMGAGIPEEIWIYRKAPTSNSNAYADVPVTHNMARCSFCGHEDVQKKFLKSGGFLANCPSCKQFLNDGELLLPEEEYSLARWQVDADGFWRSSGNRYLHEHEIKTWGIDRLQAWWKKFNSEEIYDYDKHVEFLEMLDKKTEGKKSKLSRSFTTLPLRSNTPHVWNDVNRMHGLNMEQSRRKQQNHICPMPFDQVDRLIELYSNPGDLIADPFGGLGTTGVRALKKKRRAFLTELNDTYAKCAVGYLRETEYKNSIPTLFDLLEQTA